jgi:hypothetical protein
VLWLRGIQLRLGSWWPDTLVFVSFRPGPPFEMFARAKSKSYFEKIKSLLGVKDKVELVQLLEAINAAINANNENTRWEMDRLNPGALMQIDLIATAS